MLSLIFTMAILATANGQYPKTERSLAFTLIANTTDTSKLGIFNDLIQSWPLESYHSGAGQNVGVLTDSSELLFFVNGTIEEEAAMSTTIRLPPLNCGYGQGPDSYGVMSGQSTINAGGYLGIIIGRADEGAGIMTSGRSPYPTLYFPEPYRSQKLMVCNETKLDGVDWLPQYGVKQGEEVPDNCAEMVLLAQCAELRPVPMMNITPSGWHVREVDCYRNVSAIDWNAF